MPTHSVQQGDCIDSIAKAHGVLPELLWEHPQNAQLKSARKNKNVLYPGDSVFIPEPELKQASLQAGAKYSFKRKGVPATFKLQLKNQAQGRAGLDYELQIGQLTFTGTTDANGLIEHDIAPDAKQAKLKLLDSDEVYELNLGNLNPIEQIEGVQQRLASLGYYIGQIDGEHGQHTRTAIQFYQKHKNLSINGEIDDELKNSLKSDYGA